VKDQGGTNRGHSPPLTDPRSPEVVRASMALTSRRLARTGAPNPMDLLCFLRIPSTHVPPK